jgi:hypothetical protein
MKFKKCEEVVKKFEADIVKAVTEEIEAGLAEAKKASDIEINDSKVTGLIVEVLEDEGEHSTTDYVSEVFFKYGEKEVGYFEDGTLDNALEDLVQEVLFYGRYLGPGTHEF